VATTMLMSDGLVAAMTLVVGSFSGVSKSFMLVFPWCEVGAAVAVGPMAMMPYGEWSDVMVFFGASLAYLLFRAHRQNRSCQSPT
jgi:hypothetical protein